MEKVNIIYRVGDVVLSEYIYEDYTDYSIHFVGYTEPILISEYKTLADGIREFYKYTHRLN